MKSRLSMVLLVLLVLSIAGDVYFAGRFVTYRRNIESRQMGYVVIDLVNANKDITNGQVDKAALLLSEASGLLYGVSFSQTGNTRNDLANFAYYLRTHLDNLSDPNSPQRDSFLKTIEESSSIFAPYYAKDYPTSSLSSDIGSINKLIK